MSLSRAAIEADVAAFLRDRKSVSPFARLHSMILQMDENLPPGVVPPIRRLSEVELRGIYSSFKRMSSPTRSFVDSLVDLLRIGQVLVQVPTWSPNGGRGFTVPKNLDNYKLLLEHNLAKRYEDGKVMILPLALCREHDLIRHVHFSPLVIAPNAGKLSRVCSICLLPCVSMTSYFSHTMTVLTLTRTTTRMILCLH
jgi:hypothetical protein